MTRRAWTVPAATVAATLAALCAVSPPGAAAAGWTSPRAVQPGTDPILAFSPTGAAVIGSRVVTHGRVSGADVDLAPDGSRFAASPFTLRAPSAGHGAEALSALAISSDGYLAASFTNPGAATPVLVRVAPPPPPPSEFSTVQTVVPLGGAASGQSTPDSLSFVTTTSGELVGAGADDAGDLFTATLAAQATHFSTAPGPSGLSATDAYALATDAHGDTFLAGDGPDGCSTVAYRPAHGRFTRTYGAGNCASATPSVFDAITASGNGGAALLTENISESGTVADQLYIQAGRHGHFNAPTALGDALGGPVGLASDADGEVTAEWSDCVTGALVDGRISTGDCDIDAVTGSVATGFGGYAAAGTVLARHTPGVTLSAFTADRAVAVSRCRGVRCTFTVATARPGGGFRAAHRLGAGRRLIALTGDAHGDLLAVWAVGNDEVWAATGSAATGRWGADRRLSRPGIDPSSVTALYGPRSRALVAWSSGTRTDVAGYSLR